ncbi:MAG: hypothetical protein D6805_01295 [Planctomycetota bacterium]|nr:MAG: hypothetical protein D6805_01295 [Planctomycetota bacterium]
MDKVKLSKIVNFLHQYKNALVEKALDKISEFGGEEDDMQYSLGNFAMEDFMDNNAMRLSHLNVLICELQNQLEEQTHKYEQINTEVYEIKRHQLREKIKFYTERIPPAELKWLHLEKVSENLYLLIIVRRVEV